MWSGDGAGQGQGQGWVRGSDDVVWMGWLQEAIRSSFEGYIIPTFENSCRNMFEQVDSAFKHGMEEHVAIAQQQFSTMHAPLASTLQVDGRADAFWIVVCGRLGERVGGVRGRIGLGWGGVWWEGGGRGVRSCDAEVVVGVQDTVASANSLALSLKGELAESNKRLVALVGSGGFDAAVGSNRNESTGFLEKVGDGEVCGIGLVATAYEGGVCRHVWAGSGGAAWDVYLETGGVGYERSEEVMCALW